MIHKPSRMQAAVSLGAAAALLLTSCSGQGDEGEGDLSKLTVTMPVIPPFFQITTPWVAQDQGFYDDFGLEVKLVSLDSGITALRGSMAKSADIAGVPTPSVINAAAQGSDVKAFFSYSHALDVQLVVTPDVESCEDLRGKTLGIDEVGGFGEVLTRKFYASCGLTPEDVTYTNVAGAQAQAMVQGQTSSGVLHIDQAAEAMSKFPDAGLQPLADFWHELPDWHYSGFVAPESLLEERREDVVAFTAANILATEFMKDESNKEAVLDTAEKVTQKSRDILSDAYDAFLANGLWPETHGYPKDMVEYTIDQQVQLGNITNDQAPSYEDLVDVSIYEEALALIDAQGR